MNPRRSRTALLAAFAMLLTPAAPALALNEDLQCVPYARQLSGVKIYGDAHTWWKKAEGRYSRGSMPKVGAVMSFRPYKGMKLGHVAAVSKIVDSRTVLVSHANWSQINGSRGHIENNVPVIDVSPENDWSQVSVWWTPTGVMGSGKWPLNGFIYPDKPPKAMPTGFGPIGYAAKRPVGYSFGKNFAAATPAPKPKPVSRDKGAIFEDDDFLAFVGNQRSASVSIGANMASTRYTPPARVTKTSRPVSQGTQRSTAPRSNPAPRVNVDVRYPGSNDLPAGYVASVPARR